MQDGSYRLALFVDRHIGKGLLTMFARHGQGHDGLFQLEVHVSGAGNDLRGVVNLLMVADVASLHAVPHHFSLAVIGSGDHTGFNLIGHGPDGVIVEVDARWQQPLPASSALIGPD